MTNDLAETWRRIELLRAQHGQPFNWERWYAELGKIDRDIFYQSGTELQALAERQAEEEISKER